MLQQILPAYEQVKQRVVDQMFSLSDQSQKIRLNHLLKRRDRMTNNEFISSVISFYDFLRPKMYGQDYPSMPKADIDEFVKVMDFYSIKSPRKLSRSEALEAVYFMFEFCEVAGLTRLTAAESGKRL